MTDKEVIYIIAGAAASLLGVSLANLVLGRPVSFAFLSLGFVLLLWAISKLHYREGEVKVEDRTR